MLEWMKVNLGKFKSPFKIVSMVMNMHSLSENFLDVLQGQGLNLHFF